VHDLPQRPLRSAQGAPIRPPNAGRQPGSAQPSAGCTAQASLQGFSRMGRRQHGSLLDRTLQLGYEEQA